MKTFCFSALFNGKDWIEPAYVTVDHAGSIQSVESQTSLDIKNLEHINGYALPGFQNAHSHAFQYAMAGLAEHLPANRNSDDFWSWRELMYRLAQKITPEQFESVATMAYSEMLRSGITAVVEFHYLHHDSGGKPYSQLAEMAHRLISAAETAGIHLTLLPVFYQLGGFSEAPRPNQARFISSTIDDYARLYDATKNASHSRSDLVVGIGVHSLRAVKAEDVIKAFALDPSAVAHLHVAEQKREVVDCIKHLGARPVTWLMDNLPINHRFSLIHATHTEPVELKRLAKAGATVVICPSTEGNLGDGLINLPLYRENKGQIAIGTDSQVGLNPFEELRWLDYSQRLHLLKRNILCLPGEDSGTVALTETWRHGRLSMGLFESARVGPFAIGSSFDAAIIDTNHPILVGKPVSRRLSAITYGGDPSVLIGVMRRGKWVIRHGQHTHQAKILENYKRAINTLEL